MSLDLSELDAGFAEAMRRRGGPSGEGVGAAPANAPSLTAAPTIPNGIFTLTFPDGSWKTWKIHTKPADSDFAPGRRILSLLIGPQNTDDFEGVGFVTNEGFQVWRRFRGTRTDAYAATLWRLATGEAIEGYELAVSERCLRCNRRLTTPTAIKRKIGDTCWRIMNG